ncbi:MAG: hypothetical protein AAFU79_03505 [Myxococcota bacterium]
MAAPAITLSRGPLTYTINPIIKDGVRISASMSSASQGADWVFSVTTSVVDAAIVDDEDESATFNATSTRVPFNEAPTLEAATAKLQALVDVVFDQFIPSPAAPAS